MNVELFIQNVRAYCALKKISPTSACVNSGAGRNLLSNMKKGESPSFERIQALATYLGCTVADLTGEKSIDAQKAPATADKDALMAAFWGGEKDLTKEDLEDMWDDVERFAAFLAEQKRQEKNQ